MWALMDSRLSRLVACILFASGSVLSCAHAAEDPPPWAAITYVEHPEDGPMFQSGRALSTSGRARYGIDINSVIDVNVDANKLQTALLPRSATGRVTERATRLRARLGRLDSAAQALRRESESVKGLFDLWSSGNRTSFEQRLRESARRRDEILGALYDARRQRLEEAGMERQAADRAAKAAFDAVLFGPQLEYGYDWRLLGQLFKEELDYANADLRKLEPDLGLRMGVSAHLIPRAGPAVPVHLQNYNEAATAAETRYEKLRFAASEEQKELFKQHEEMAKSVGEAKNVGEAVLKILEAEYRTLRAQLETVTAAAEMAWNDLRGRADRLQRWRDAQTRNAWMAQVGKQLKGTNDGERVLLLWQRVGDALEESSSDLAALKVYADLRRQLAGKTAVEAMDALLTSMDALRDPRNTALRVLDIQTWKRRLSSIDEFVVAVKALTPQLASAVTSTDGPYTDLVALREAINRFVESTRDAASSVARWVGEVMFSLRPSRTAAELPEAPGARRLEVRTGGELSTVVNLLQIPGRREVGDVLRVRYTFHDGSSEVPTGWIDEFSLQSYGWTSEVLASVAFAKQSGRATWKPTAAMNWMLAKNDWPKAGETGLARSRLKWFSGAGLSVMPLDQEGNEGVQLGLGLTIGLLNNRLLIGAGTNLQASTDKGFAFVSIRLVEFPGLSGPLGGTGGVK